MPQYTLNSGAATATTITYSVDSGALTASSPWVLVPGPSVTVATNDMLEAAYFAYLDPATNASSTGWTGVATNATPGWWDATATAVVTANSNWYTHPAVQALLTPAEQEAQRVRIAAVKEAEDTARARAEVLLDRYLRDDQRVTLREKGWFLVEAKSGARYRIYRGRSHNVKLLDSRDREVASLCAHPRDVVPEADCMLSQKLMLELAEDKFLAIANKRHLMSNIMPERRLAA